jgi:hypothetical protein
MLKSNPKQKKPNQAEQLKNLRRLFKFNADGTPDIYSYGVFKVGVSSTEIDEYLQVRLNTLNIKRVRQAVNGAFSGSTCPVASFNRQSVCLFYRHDVQRFADLVISKTPTYFD